MLNSHHTEQRNERVADEERVEQLVGDLTQLLNFGLVAPTRLPRHLPPSRLPAPPPSRSIGDPPTQGRAVAMVSHPKNSEVARSVRHDKAHKDRTRASAGHMNSFMPSH